MSTFSFSPCVFIFCPHNCSRATSRKLSLFKDQDLKLKQSFPACQREWSSKMVNESSDGPSKRPRMNNVIDLAEYDDVLNRVQELEKENRRLKKVERENKELRDAMNELRGMVECPVCLLVPRQGGPLPVCSNGHFVCCTCRDRIRPFGKRVS